MLILPAAPPFCWLASILLGRLPSSGKIRRSNFSSIDHSQVLAWRGLHGVQDWTRANHWQVYQAESFQQLCIVMFRFHVIMGSDSEAENPPSCIPGNALVVDPKLPFRPLAKYYFIFIEWIYFFMVICCRFGNSFLNRFQCTRQKNQLLSEITLIDTPGILAGEKQNTDR